MCLLLMYIMYSGVKSVLTLRNNMLDLKRSCIYGCSQFISVNSPLDLIVCVTTFLLVFWQFKSVHQIFLEVVQTSPKPKGVQIVPMSTFMPVNVGPRATLPLSAKVLCLLQLLWSLMLCCFAFNAIESKGCDHTCVYKTYP